jgi:hypothetical protein
MFSPPVRPIRINVNAIVQVDHPSIPVGREIRQQRRWRIATIAVLRSGSWREQLLQVLRVYTQEIDQVACNEIEPAFFCRITGSGDPHDTVTSFLAFCAETICK